MAVITKIDAAWTDWQPPDFTGITTTNRRDEILILWGTDGSGPNINGIGFVPESPPDLPIAQRTEFVVGKLNLYWQIPPVLSPTRVTLALRLHFADRPSVQVAVPITIEADIFHISIAVPAPNTVLEAVGARITSQGLLVQLGPARSARGTVLQARRGTKSSALLYLKIEEFDRSFSAELEAPPCPDDFTPVFDPSKCDLPEICPIEEIPLIENCALPDVPSPITDCPDIDLFVPAIGTIGPPGPPGPPGSPGPPGPPGSPGPPGCKPKVTVTYEIIRTINCTGPPIEVYSFQYGQCNTHLHIIVYQCDDDCCYYVCCNGEWQVLRGGPHCLLPGQTYSPGPGDPSEPLYPPTQTCADQHLTIMICPCQGISSSSASPYCVPVTCGCNGNCNLLTDRMRVQITGDTDLCPCLLDIPSEAQHDGSNCWVAASTTPCSHNNVNITPPMVSLCCIGSQPVITFSCHGGTISKQAECIGDRICSFKAVFDHYELAVFQCCIEPQSHSSIPFAQITVIFTEVSDECHM